MRLFVKLCYLISQQTSTFLWNFTTHVQSIVTDICKVLRYRTSLTVFLTFRSLDGVFSSSTLSSTLPRTSQRTEFVSVIKINHDKVLSYMYGGLYVSILLFLSDYSRDRNTETYFLKYSKPVIRLKWIRWTSRFFVRANRRTDMTRLIVTLGSFSRKASKKETPQSYQIHFFSI
jgi:hypothetical protein